jgi:hypothetical protein
MSTGRCRGAPGLVRRVTEKNRASCQEWANGVLAAAAAPVTRVAGVGEWRRVERRRREGRRCEKAMGSSSAWWDLEGAGRRGRRVCAVLDR